jgi:hypothetical protein
MLLVATCAAACAALPVAAVTYKWIDENGRVVYGDTPPPGAKAERINVGLPPADTNAVRDLATKDAELRKRQQARADEEAKAEKAVADEKAVLERCTQARGRMQTLRSGDALYRYNEKGEKVYFDAPERERAIAETDRALRELNCAPVGSAPVAPPTTSTTSTY